MNENWNNNTNAKIPYLESEMSQFLCLFGGNFQYFKKCAGVKHVTNIMSVPKSVIIVFSVTCAPV